MADDVVVPYALYSNKPVYSGNVVESVPALTTAQWQTILAILTDVRDRCGRNWRVARELLREVGGGE